MDFSSKSFWYVNPWILVKKFRMSPSLLRSKTRFSHTMWYECFMTVSGSSLLGLVPQHT